MVPIAPTTEILCPMLAWPKALKEKFDGVETKLTPLIAVLATYGLGPEGLARLRLHVDVLAVEAIVNVTEVGLNVAQTVRL